MGGQEAKGEGNQDLNMNPHPLIKAMMAMDATSARS